MRRLFVMPDIHGDSSADAAYWLKVRDQFRDGINHSHPFNKALPNDPNDANNPVYVVSDVALLPGNVHSFFMIRNTTARVEWGLFFPT